MRKSDRKVTGWDNVLVAVRPEFLKIDGVKYEILNVLKFLDSLLDTKYAGPWSDGYRFQCEDFQKSMKRRQVVVENKFRIYAGPKFVQFYGDLRNELKSAGFEGVL